MVLIYGWYTGWDNIVHRPIPPNHMPLRPVTLDDSMLGQSLPWDLYTVSGVLIARAGMMLADAEHLAKAMDRPLFREATGADADMSARLRRLVRNFPLAFNAVGTERLEPTIRILGHEIKSLARLDHDACLGLMRLLPMADPAARHCLLTALIALDMAEQMSAPDDPLIDVTVHAALTMNIAAMRLHGELTERQNFSNQTQRDSIAHHPQDSLNLLKTSGLRDQDWLTAVGQHHENLDGSGYPNGLCGDAIGSAARIIRIADFYGAKIRGRRYRPALSARSAFKQIFGDERGRLDSHFALLLLRRLGLHPPGTLLRLADREVAVVTRKQGSGETPGKVIAFLGPHGHLLKASVERNTKLVDYAIFDVVEADASWPEIRWECFWGY